MTRDNTCMTIFYLFIFTFIHIISYLIPVNFSYNKLNLIGPWQFIMIHYEQVLFSMHPYWIANQQWRAQIWPTTLVIISVLFQSVQLLERLHFLYIFPKGILVNTLVVGHLGFLVWNLLRMWQFHWSLSFRQKCWWNFPLSVYII